MTTVNVTFVLEGDECHHNAFSVPLKEVPNIP